MTQEAFSDLDPRRITGSWAVLNIPEKMYHCQLSNFDWKRAPHAVSVVRDFLGTARQREAPHLFLTGGTGLGKSHILYGLYRWAVKEWDTMRATTIYVPKFCDEVKKGYDQGVDPFDDLEQATHFIGLDDLIGRELSQHELNQILPRIIQISHENKAAVVQTTNYTYEELSTFISPHELDRLFENAIILEFMGPSYRLGT